MESPIAFNSLVLGNLPARHARYRPHHTAVIVPARAPGDRDVRLSWREFDAYVNRWANVLAGLGVRRGERVATLLPNSLELLATYWSCAKLGAAIVPLSPLLTAPGLQALLVDARPRAVLASSDQLAMIEAVRPVLERGRADAASWVLVDAAGDDERAGYRAFGALMVEADDAAPAARVEAGDLLTLMYSAGATGLPKAVQHPHFIGAMYALTMANAWRMARESVVLQSDAPVFNGAMSTMFPAFLCGATLIVHRPFDAQGFMAMVEAERVTHTMLVPSQIIAILDAPGIDPARFASLETVLFPGAPLHQDYRDRLHALLPRQCYQLYGLTEGFITVLDRDDAVRKAGSVGVPPPFFELRIVGDDGRDMPSGEVGEIVGRGPITMPGYYHRAEQTAHVLRDGWLHTGDVGYLDAEGYLYRVDRTTDRIDAGGMKF